MSLSTTLPAHIFRAYDIRGLVDQELTADTYYRLGLAFGHSCRLQGLRGVAVGGDNRPSTPGFAQSLSDGIQASGLDTFEIGIQPTPLGYFAREMVDRVGMAMVTASHNPKEFNGLKLGFRHAALSEEEIQALRPLTDSAQPAVVRGHRREIDVRTAYLEDYDIRVGGPLGLRVVADCGNGTAGLYEPALSQQAAGACQGLFVEPNASYPNHHPDPSVAANLAALAAAVVDSGADLGVGYDGDADRLGVVDHRGSFVMADRLMALWWQRILEDHPGVEVPVEVKCSKILYDLATKWGGRPFYCRSGHAPMKIMLRQRRLLFAGELSGHLFFADDYYGFDDAFYAAGRLYRMVAAAGRPLADLLAELPQTVSTDEIRFATPDADKFRLVQALSQHYAARLPVVTVDGMRVEFPDGWCLVRASNTQPVAVFRAEADDQAGLERILKDVARSADEVGWPALTSAAEQASAQ